MVSFQSRRDGTFLVHRHQINEDEPQILYYPQTPVMPPDTDLYCFSEMTFSEGEKKNGQATQRPMVEGNENTGGIRLSGGGK